MLIGIEAGGMFTMLGSTPALYINGALAQNNLQQIGFFQIFYVTGPCFVFVILFIACFAKPLIKKD